MGGFIMEFFKTAGMVVGSLIIISILLSLLWVVKFLFLALL